jgi:hypothetical protein
MSQLKSLFQPKRKSQIGVFQRLCLKYFCQNQSIPSDGHSILHFLSKFNYSAFDFKTIEKMLESENPEPLDSILNFNSFPVSHFLQFSKMVITQNDSSKYFESDFLYPWIFRGILVISYFLKNELNCYLKGLEFQHFPPEFWFSIQYSLKFLLFASKEE